MLNGGRVNNFAVSDDSLSLTFDTGPVIILRQMVDSERLSVNLITFRQSVGAGHASSNLITFRQSVILHETFAKASVITFNQVVNYTKPSTNLITMRQRVYDE